MDILGIGMPELVFIIIIALIILGPKDMQKAGKTIGSFLRKIVASSEWRTIKDLSRKVSTLPNQLMREANEELNDFREGIDNTLPKIENSFGSWDGSSSTQQRPEFVLPKKKDETKSEKAISASTSESQSKAEGEDA